MVITNATTKRTLFPKTEFCLGMGYLSINFKELFDIKLKICNLRYQFQYKITTSNKNDKFSNYERDICV